MTQGEDSAFRDETMPAQGQPDRNGPALRESFGIVELGIDPVTLAFRDSNAEAEFQKDFFEKNLRHGRLCHLLAILFYAGDGLRDFLLFQDALLPLLMVRFGVIVPVFVLGLVVSYRFSGFYCRHWQKLFFAYVLVTGFGAIAITTLATPPLGHSLYVGVIYCLIFGYTFIRLRFIAAAAAGLILTVGYAVAARWIMALPVPVLWVHLPYLVGVNLLGMFVAFYLELSARRGFRLNRLLARQKDDLDAANQSLEMRIRERTRELEASNQALVEKIDQLKDMDQKREQLEHQLLQTQKLESIGTLASGIAHDFNNLLTPVIGYTELALDQIDPKSELARNLSAVLAAGGRAKDLVRQILTFSRQEKTFIHPISVADIATEATGLLRSTLPATIDILRNFRAERTTIIGDATQVHQVIMNLCTNAAHAMEGNEGRIELSMDNVAVPFGKPDEPVDLAPGDYLRLSVADSGKGMPPEVIKRIFDPFFTTKEPGKGTGMGLSVVHGIVHSLHGEIRVSSQPGKGARFDIFLPVTEENVSPGDSDSASVHLAGSGHILMVDDEGAIVRLQRQSLERLGHRVTARIQSEAALADFRTDPQAYDLLITDLTMPRLTGDRLIAEVKKIRPDLPVILCTGYSETVSEDQAREMGIDRFFIKPVGNADLAAAVNRLLANRKGTAPVSK